jgi:hypothetical protein
VPAASRQDIAGTQQLSLRHGVRHKQLSDAKLVAAAGGQKKAGPSW